MSHVAIINTKNKNLVSLLSRFDAVVVDARWGTTKGSEGTDQKTLADTLGRKYMHAKALSPRYGEKPETWIERCAPFIERTVELAKSKKSVVFIHHNTKLLKLFAHFIRELGEETTFFYDFKDGKTGECIAKPLTHEEYVEAFTVLFPEPKSSFSSSQSEPDATGAFGDLL